MLLSQHFDWGLFFCSDKCLINLVPSTMVSYLKKTFKYLKYFHVFIKT